MEEVKIKEFLAVSSGDGSASGYGSGSASGYGDGSGSGYGDGYGSGSASGYGDGSGSGYGDGSGSGSGYGSGYGSGSGSGSGYGSGYGIKSYNGEAVNMIDGIPTILRYIRDNIAKGFIVNRDLTLQPCYVVKQDNFFAHGKTLHEAMEDLREKLFEDMPEEERIELFVKEHAADAYYPNMDFFSWHNRLTGSCDMGRRTFASDRGIDLNGSMTVKEFILLAENAYGGSVIKKLKPYYFTDGD